jgi:hypothetical protein
MKCDHCGESIKEGGVGCDWRQGRCPHRTPLINPHSFRYLNLINSIKQLFKRG